MRSLSLLQIIYVSLSTKGKFYEIEQTNPQLFAKNGSNGRKPKELNSDCVHRISCIITDETVFPINLKFISKQTNGLTNNTTIPGKIAQIIDNLFSYIYIVMFLFIFKITSKSHEFL